MSPELAVALGAAVGAPARYLLDVAIARPWGILLVNLLGCAAAGLLAGLAPAGVVAPLVLVGFLGSFTTASTLAWDVLERGAWLLALHVVPGLALAGAFFALGRAL